LPDGHVVRYEDMVVSGGKALAAIVPGSRDLNKLLSSRNANEPYDRKYVAEIGAKLLESEEAYWRLYPRDNVKVVLARFT